MQVAQNKIIMDRGNKRLARRYRRERRFRRLGLGAVITSICFLGLLFGAIIMNGWSAFQQTEIQLDVHFDEERFQVDNLAAANYGALVKECVLCLLTLRGVLITKNFISW